MWIIQNKIFGEETDKLVKYLSNSKIPYELVQSDYDIDSLTAGDSHIVRGTIQFVEALSKRFEGLVDNINLKSYECIQYQSKVKTLNSDCIYLPYGKLYESRDLIRKIFPGSQVFIKPNSGRKLFDGTTISYKWWKESLNIVRNLPHSHVKDEDLVLVSSNKEIKSEIRCLMHLGNLIDYSWYKGEKMSPDLSLLKFNWYPSYFYTVDLAYTDKWNILEFNSFESAGLYDMRPENYVPYIERVLVI